MSGISIYPEKGNIAEIKNYIKNSSELDFKYIFTSLHIPEYSLEEQLSLIANLSNFINELNMKLICDIRGSVLKEIYHENEKRKEFGNYKIYGLRLDFEVDEELFEISKNLGVKNIFFNASTIKEFELKKYIEFCKNNDLELIGFHNYYPRPETGLSQEFFDKQNLMIKKYGLKIFSFIPGKKNYRKPIFEGLPTLEKHRKMDIKAICLDVYNTENIDEIFISDPNQDLEYLKMLQNILVKQKITFQIDIIDEEYKDILLEKMHQIRYDSGEYQYRLEGYRVHFSNNNISISPKNNFERKKGSITIDNEKYGRYKGEIQIILEDLPKDEKVNIIARIAQEDIKYLEYIDSNFTIEFK